MCICLNIFILKKTIYKKKIKINKGKRCFVISLLHNQIPDHKPAKKYSSSYSLIPHGTR